MTPVLLRVSGVDSLQLNPGRIHHTLSRESPAKPVEANGGPLSERILVGRPYSRKVASISGRTCAVSLRATL